MTKSDEFIDAFVGYVQEKDEVEDVVGKLKAELNALGFSPSDGLISLVITLDPILDPPDEDEEDDEDEDEDEDEGYWGDDEDEEEED